MNSIVRTSAMNGSSESSAPINWSLNGSEAAHGSASNASNPEVVAVKRRRLISRSDKRRILRDYDRCKKPGERGALLRAKRVYSCSGLQSKHAGLAISAVFCSEYLQLMIGAGSRSLQTSLRSVARARNPSAPAQAICN